MVAQRALKSGFMSGRAPWNTCSGAGSRPRERARETSGCTSATVPAQPSRVAPTPTRSCISTIAPGTRAPSTLAIISSGASPRQASVFAVKPTSLRLCSLAIASVAGMTKPHGVRQSLTRCPSCSRVSSPCVGSDLCWCEGVVADVLRAVEGDPVSGVADAVA